MRLPKGHKTVWMSMIVMLVILSFVPFAAPAQANAVDYYATHVDNKCELVKELVVSTDLDKAYLVEYIVECTKTVVKDAFIVFLVQFYSLVSTAAQAVLTLAVVIFGVMLVSGMVEKPSRDGFVLLFKLGCVLFFIQPDRVLQIFNMGMDSMDALTDLVFQYNFFSSDGRCFDDATLWDRVDCTLDVLIGTVKDPVGGGGYALEGISRGMMHFFASNIASTSLGAVIGLLGFYVTFTVLFAIIKSIHTYLAAIIALSFILMLAPMFVPMIMFKQTRSYFDKWMRIGISFVLQPVILFAFLSLMLIAMETMMLTGEDSLLKTIDSDLNEQNKFVSQALEDQGAYGSKAFKRLFDPGDTSDRNLVVEEDGAMGRRAEDPRAKTGDLQAAAEGFGIMSTRWDRVQYDKLENCGSPEECQKILAMITLTMALTAFVFISMLNYIPHLATDLTGGIYEVPNLYTTMGANLPGGNMVQQQMQGATNKATESLRGGLNSVKKQFSGMVGNR